MHYAEETYKYTLKLVMLEYLTFLLLILYLSNTTNANQTQTMISLGRPRTRPRTQPYSTEKRLTSLPPSENQMADTSLAPLLRDSHPFFDSSLKIVERKSLPTTIVPEDKLTPEA